MPNGALSAGVTVGGASGTQTLQVAGTTQGNGTFQDSVFNPGYSGQQLTIGAHGVLQMTSSGSNPGRSIVGGDIVSSGLITVDPGASGPNTGRDLRANVTNNAGGVIAFHTDVTTCGCGSGGTWINNGMFTTDAGTTSTLSRTGAGINFTQSGGTLANNGEIAIDGTLTHSGGGTTGNPIQICGTLNPAGPGTASFAPVGTASCNSFSIGSDIGSGDTVEVNTTTSLLDAYIGSFTNHGTLSFDSSSGHLVQLHAGQSDVFTNAGTLNFTGTNVAVKLVNNGTTNIVASPGLSTNFNTPITQAAGTLTVAGTLNAQAGVTLSGGTIANPGTLGAIGFTHTGGNATGNPVMVCSYVSAPGPGTGSFQLLNAAAGNPNGACGNPYIASDIGAGDTVEVHADNAQLDAFIGSFTNHGTLSFDSSSGHLVQLHAGQSDVFT
ncbi:MAG: hypothetical protein M3071_14195, partial [Actinomycetota bacterium]|nr:hypothetical protein [Actinomycetota bacterium]